MILDELAEMLEEANTTIDNAVSRDIRDQLEISQQATNNMLNTCFAISNLKGDKDELL